MAFTFTIFGQTSYQFISSGAANSTRTGFRTTNTNPTEANLIISNSINVSSLKSGLYFLNIKTKTGMTSKRLMKI
ncbi:T9SS type A sorting domain-containing protein [Flavivirga rizhaonensis]|uniref:T9SS type A sorting domain-containing protein n=1 Tax=Flavivirga rizhaonensis TaxID=2559571 RepID=UPI001477159B|nr:T9SS type A sorting domain-containing protein [Flavivirga rizhaonensis]